MGKTRYLLLCLAALLFSGCSDIKTYQDTPDKNLHVHVKLKDDDERITGYLNLFAETSKCHFDYVGSVELNKSVVDIGLPPGKNLQMTFDVTRSSILGGTHDMKLSAALRVRAGYNYYAKFSWVDGMYDLKMFESLPHRSSMRKIPVDPSNGC